MRGSTALLASLLITASADASTFILEEQVAPRFEISLTASDGLNTSTDSVVLTDPFGGSAVADLQGVLNPELFVSLILIEIPETMVDLVFGTAEIQATLTFSAFYEWQPNLGIDIGDARSLSTGVLTSFGLSGELAVLGDTIPFDFNLADYPVPQISELRDIDGNSGSFPKWSAPNETTFALGVSRSGDLTMLRAFSAALASVITQKRPYK